MLRAIVACCALLAALPAPAAAEWQFAPMVGLTFKGVTNIIDPEVVDDKAATTKVHRHLGGAVALLGEGVLGVEAIATWAPRLFQQGDLQLVETGRAASLMGNIVVTTPRRLTEYSLRPYVSAGFGLMHAVVEQVESPAGPVFPPVRLNAVGYNIGAGAIGFFTERTGVRFDLRYFSTLRRSNEALVTIDPESAYLRYMTVSVGIVFRR